MRKLAIYYKRIRKVLRWIPIIWRDRDWDYYYIYEILKQKLIATEEYIRKDGIHIYNEADADSIKKAIDMIEKVQKEYYLDKYLSEGDWHNDEGMRKAMEDQDKARKELFEYLDTNIEKWWD